MEEAVAKSQRGEERTTSVADKSDQSGDDSTAEKREGVVTTTVIGKPNWGEADKINKRPLEDEKATNQQEERQDNPTSQAKQ